MLTLIVYQLYSLGEIFVALNNIVPTVRTCISFKITHGLSCNDIFTTTCPHQWQRLSIADYLLED